MLADSMKHGGEYLLIQQAADLHETLVKSRALNLHLVYVNISSRRSPEGGRACGISLTAGPISLKFFVRFHAFMLKVPNISFHFHTKSLST